MSAPSELARLNAGADRQGREIHARKALVAGPPRLSLFPEKPKADG